MGRTEERDVLCGICPAGCWVRAELEDGRLVEVAPQPGHPLGMICNIGRHSPAVVYDPDRLQHPMRRAGPKGTHEFERISWDQAFEIIAEQLQGLKAEHGPESTAIYTGRGSFDMALCDLFQPAGVAVSSASSVLFPFGSPNTLGVGALCYVSFAMIAPHVTMGEMLITMDSDLEQAELIVVWGANPATDSPPLAYHQILAARKRGAEVVVIDTRRTETAQRTGAEWIAVRPGTDGALALGLIQVLIEEELYDEELVEKWTVGFAELAQLTQHYRPEVVEGITGVPAEQVRELARRIAGARGAAPVMYSGLEYSDSGVQAIRAVHVLWALAGQLDVPGGLLFRMKENLFPQNRNGLIANPDPKHALGRDRFPVYKTLLCQVGPAEDGDGAFAGGRAASPGEACPEEAPVEVQEAPTRHVYLDHNATTPVAPEVVEAMLPHLGESFGNPSSIHRVGTGARDAVEVARRSVAQALGCTARRIVFTGSACKSGNPDPSHVLLAAGLTSDEAHCSVRLSLGVGNTEDDIDYTLTAISETLADTLTAIRFVPCR